jgi:ABC-type branched-subunit amino acid transport system substrate-binding protein
MVEWKKPKAACIMYQDDEYGKNVFDGFTQQLDAMKMKAASVTTYKRGASDFSAQAAKMKSDGCDLVVMGTVIRETIGLMAEAKKIGFAPIWLGATPVNVLEIPALGKELVEGLYAAAGFVIPYRDTSTGAVKAWCEAYFKKFNVEPNSQAVIGYNVVMTFAHYAQLAGKDLTGQKLLDALESGNEYKDIFGSPPTKFSKTNHLATTITQVQEVKNGRWVLVKGDLLF